MTSSHRHRGIEPRIRPLARTLLPAALSSALALGAAQAAGDATRIEVLAQKTRLVEQFLRSPRAAAVSSGTDAGAKALLARADDLLAQSRQAASPTEAERHLNDALRLAGEALRMRGSDGDSSMPRRNDELRVQVLDYRAALHAVGGERRAQTLQPLAAIDTLLTEAQALGAGGRHVEANGALSRAYEISARTLAAVRAGETVTIELKFATLAEEFDYERRRFDSHEMLVAMALAERQPTGDTRAAIQVRSHQAKALSVQAHESAGRGEYRQAIRLLEDATRELVRALQALGVPVF